MHRIKDCFDFIPIPAMVLVGDPLYRPFKQRSRQQHQPSTHFPDQLADGLDIRAINLSLSGHVYVFSYAPLCAYAERLEKYIFRSIVLPQSSRYVHAGGVIMKGSEQRKALRQTWYAQEGYDHEKI